MKTMNSYIISLVLTVLAATLVGCGSDSSSYSVLADGDLFFQNNPGTSTKIDVLWVIDNSGSMQTSQENLSNNFDSFINKFVEKEFDFNLAITTTDAYRGRPEYNGGTDNLGMSDFKGGIFTEDTPDLINLFKSHVLQGTSGHHDERAFQSFHTAFENPNNSGFLREDSFLAVILVSDEDDFSWDGTDWLEAVHSGNLNNVYADPNLHSVDSYIGYLDALTGSTAQERRYMVSTISIQDTACQDLLNQSHSGRKIGLRYAEIATKTGGEIGSLCEPFDDTLKSISDTIAELSTIFYLTREPLVETIKVIVDGQEISQSPDGIASGWFYLETSNAIKFIGDAVPPQGAAIQITFDPASLEI